MCCRTDLDLLPGLRSRVQPRRRHRRSRSLNPRRSKAMRSKVIGRRRPLRAPRDQEGVVLHAVGHAVARRGPKTVCRSPRRAAWTLPGGLSTTRCVPRSHNRSQPARRPRNVREQSPPRRPSRAVVPVADLRTQRDPRQSELRDAGPARARQRRNERLSPRPKGALSSPGPPQNLGLDVRAAGRMMWTRLPPRSPERTLPVSRKAGRPAHPEVGGVRSSYPAKIQAKDPTRAGRSTSWGGADADRTI